MIIQKDKILKKIDFKNELNKINEDMKNSQDNAEIKKLKAKILNCYRKIPVFLGNENKKFQISKIADGARNENMLE